MGKTRRLDPEELKDRMDFWRGEIRRVGRGDRRGGVFRLPGHDQDGRSVSHEEELALDRAVDREFPDDNPLLRERE